MKQQNIFFLLSALLISIPSLLTAIEDRSSSSAEASLIISDGSRFEPKDSYPEFSWEVTPQYFMFGDTERVLVPDEVRSIAARTGFICIEKFRKSLFLN